MALQAEVNLAGAQTYSVGAFVAAATNSEVQETREAKGLGFGLAARAERSRLRADLRYLHAALKAAFSVQPDYDVDELDVRLTYLWRPYLGAQIGAARRFISPDFVAQDVGILRMGVVSEARLSRIAGLWVRGAYLPLSRFSGGGGSGLGLEVGLGADVGPPGGRWQAFVEFDYQRIDRDAPGPAPVQFSSGQVGVRVRL
jgi:hypothetical protein